MSLQYGRHYLAIPGPSVMPDRVLNAMHQAAPNIYEGALHDMVETLYPDLKAIARTEGDVAIYIGNGHAAWEAALTNTLSRGDRVLVLATGSFAMGWASNATGLGIEVEVLDFGKRSDVDLDRLETTLRADTSHQYKAVMVVHTDTATSVKSDIAAIRGCIDACAHPALFMADCIASLACDPFEMDAWGVDLMVAACQKGLMTPPGLAFVYFGEKAKSAHSKAGLVTPYWNWAPRTNPQRFAELFNGTAPTHHLFALREALNMLVHEEGMEAVFARHEKLSRAVWSALDCWAADGPIELNIASPEKRSCAVTTVRIGAPLGTDLRRWLEFKAGVTLGIGLGMAPEGDPEWHGFFRIGHMGHVNAHMVLGVLGTIEAGLIALDIPHGSGALNAAARVISEA